MKPGERGASRGSDGRRRIDGAVFAGALLAPGLVLGGHGLEGGGVQSLRQGAAAGIVFGGTLGAVVVSFALRDPRAAGLRTS